VPALAVFIGTLINQIVGTADLSDSQVKEFIRPKLSTLGQMVEVQLVSGETFVGSAVSISDTGALIVDKNSELLEVVSGDVIHLRSADAR
jgi:biotin-(acetyl-CoA carboxylase) ligase